MVRTIRLNEADNVVVAMDELAPGTDIAAEGVRTRGRIPPGHKVATRAIAKDEPIRKYGQIIGFAGVPIGPGEHVHTDNCVMGDFQRDYAHGQAARPTAMVTEAERAVFQGIVRADGRVGTRNYIGVLSTVNCSATVAKMIAARFDGDALEPFAHVDGVSAFVHGSGCGMAVDDDGFANLQRILWGYIRHPNFAGVLLVGLGCEVNQVRLLMQSYGIEEGPAFRFLVIQDSGGTAQTVAAGERLIREMLPAANRAVRQTVSAGHLMVALQCGGSDGYSGVTANPALGAAVDLLVAHGGTGILAETPEVYGAEHLLTRRAVSRDIGEKLIGRIRWWEDYTARLGGRMDNNPSPGNKAGGLTTILEKSLGAVAKAGTTNLTGVYEYAEQVTEKGFVFMDTPGYDPVSITGEVAGGANLVCFTTGRGSVFGFKPSPSIKLATNTAMYERMRDDMDINCGAILSEGVSVGEMGERIFRLWLEVASGAPSKSERLGFGDHEFAPWLIGAVM